MSKRSYYKAEDWKKIHSHFDNHAQQFGLPATNKQTVTITTFNIRKLGKYKNKSPEAWEFLVKTLKAFDLIAIQEILDDLEGIRFLCDELNKEENSYGLVVSDATGTFPGMQGNTERLGFLFNWKRVKRTELASDITYDRSKVAGDLYEHNEAYAKAWQEHDEKLIAWKKKCIEAKNEGKDTPSKPPLVLPRFLTFIRQPHCASFEIPGAAGKEPLKFLAINAHLLYGTNKEERLWEFNALIDWITIRAKKRDTTYYNDFILLGDCNLEFESMNIKRDEIDDQLKKLNKSVLKSKRAAKANFPLLTPHPKHGELTTNARMNQTYDQIGMFYHDKRLPSSDDNWNVGSNDKEYDYGVFNFVELIADALYGKAYADLTDRQKDYAIKRLEHDISDHMPAWIRLRVP
jgi:hypothetical protein